jgi:hypothetical protein
MFRKFRNGHSNGQIVFTKKIFLICSGICTSQSAMSSRDFRLFLVFVLGTFMVVVRADDDDDHDHKHWPEKIHIGVVRHFRPTFQSCTILAFFSQVDAFVSSLMMIIVSELGDKTFFIAAVGVGFA